MIVYHGTTEIVTNPDVEHSYRQIDFGKGFYVTKRALNEIKVYPSSDQRVYTTTPFLKEP